MVSLYGENDLSKHANEKLFERLNDLKPTVEPVEAARLCETRVFSRFYWSTFLFGFSSGLVGAGLLLDSPRRTP
jgi:hypothetical protein